MYLKWSLLTLHFHWYRHFSVILLIVSFALILWQDIELIEKKGENEPLGGFNLATNDGFQIQLSFYGNKFKKNVLFKKKNSLKYQFLISSPNAPDWNIYLKKKDKHETLKKKKCAVDIVGQRH